LNGAISQGSSLLATLGFEAQSLCFGIEAAWKEQYLFRAFASLSYSLRNCRKDFLAQANPRKHQSWPPWLPSRSSSLPCLLIQPV
jgi:hypothetical protein